MRLVAATENRMKLESVRGREVNTSSCPKVDPSVDHGMDQGGNSKQQERPANGSKLALLTEAVEAQLPLRTNLQTSLFNVI